MAGHTHMEGAMLETMISTWWNMTSAYFSAPALLLAGQVNVYSVLPVVGLLLLALGIVLALARREKRARWLALPAVAAALSPLVVSYIYGMMGWFGVLFFLILGGIGLLGWVGVIAGDARYRTPVWLIGFGLASYVVFCGLVSVAVIWGLA
jgi:hypothetical protein